MNEYEGKINMSMSKKELFDLIDKEVENYFNKRMNNKSKKEKYIKRKNISPELNSSSEENSKASKNSDLPELEEDEKQDHLFPAMKDFRRMSRGLMEGSITMKEFDKLVKRVVNIYALMDRAQRSEHIRKNFNQFGLMTFNEFLGIQDRMIDSSKGKLGDPKKKQAG